MIGGKDKRRLLVGVELLDAARHLRHDRVDDGDFAQVSARKRNASVSRVDLSRCDDRRPQLLAVRPLGVAKRVDAEQVKEDADLRLSTTPIGTRRRERERDARVRFT